jgi:hypothetical protein
LRERDASMQFSIKGTASRHTLRPYAVTWRASLSSSSTVGSCTGPCVARVYGKPASTPQPTATHPAGYKIRQEGWRMG